MESKYEQLKLEATIEEKYASKISTRDTKLINLATAIRELEIILSSLARITKRKMRHNEDFLRNEAIYESKNINKMFLDLTLESTSELRVSYTECIKRATELNLRLT